MSSSKIPLIVLVMTLEALVSAQWPPVKSGPGDIRCNCFRTLTVVCGTDNKNYLSQCHLDCAKNWYQVEKKSDGYCPGVNYNYVVGDIDPDGFGWGK